MGGEFSDLYPVVTIDGQYLLFTSYRPLPGETEPPPQPDIWIAKKLGTGWSTPRHVATLSNRQRYEGGLALGPGGALFYQSAAPDFSSTTSFTADYRGNGAFVDPVEFTGTRNIRQRLPELFVWGGFVEPKGRFMVLDVSPRDPDTSQPLASDIWIAETDGLGGWREPRALAAGINSDTYDNFVHFTPDGETLGFVRGFREFYQMRVEKLGLDTR